MTIKYLDSADIVAVKRSDIPEYSRYLSQYPSKAPTSYLVQLSDKRWRRVYCHQFSNSGTIYVIVNKERLIVDEHAITQFNATNQRT